MNDALSFDIGYDYDEAGNVIKITYPGNKEVIYGYDELNRLETVTNWLIQVTTYHYDAAGRLDWVEHFNGTITDYDYDTANRLTDLNIGMAFLLYDLENRVLFSKCFGGLGCWGLGSLERWCAMLHQRLPLLKLDRNRERMAGLVKLLRLKIRKQERR